jgi:hypothetical protein
VKVISRLAQRRHDGEEMRQIQLTEIQLYRDMMKIAGIEPE